MFIILYSLYNRKAKEYIIERYMERHTSYVHDVRIMGDVPHSSTKNIPKNSNKISITFCIKVIFILIFDTLNNLMSFKRFFYSLFFNSKFSHTN